MFERSDTPFKAILYGLVMLFLYLLQSVPALGFRFMGCSPELLLLLTVGAAFFESESFAAFFGLAAGLLNDVVTSDVVGASAIFFMFSAFFISILLQTALRRIFLTYVLLSLGCCALYLICEYLFLAMFFSPPPFWISVCKIFLPKFLFSGALCYLIYPVVKFCHGKTTRRNESEF